jgi:hypothetical protein
MPENKSVGQEPAAKLRPFGSPPEPSTATNQADGFGELADEQQEVDEEEDSKWNR